MRRTKLRSGQKSLQLRGAAMLVGTAESVKAAVASLEKQVAKAGKETFKSNALAESLETTLTAGIKLISAAENRRNAESHDLRQQLADSYSKGKLDVVKELLGVLDGLYRVEAAGKQVLAKEQSFFKKMLGQNSTGDLEAWLEGNRLATERLEAVLTAQGVSKIPAHLNKTFNPTLHVAVEVRNGTPNAVVEVLREGWMLNNSVLRCAEVAVAK